MKNPIADRLQNLVTLVESLSSTEGLASTKSDVEKLKDAINEIYSLEREIVRLKGGEIKTPLTLQEFRKECDKLWANVQWDWADANQANPIADRICTVVAFMPHRFDGERGRELLNKMDELLKASFAESDALKLVEEEVDEDA